MSELNKALKEKNFDRVKQLLISSPETEIDNKTLNIALFTGNLTIICDIIEAGAKPNQDSPNCASMSAPMFISVILNLLKAQGKDIKTELTEQYGPANMDYLQNMAIPEEVKQRIQQLETKSFWQSVWIARQSRLENPNFHCQHIKPYLIEYLSHYSKDTMNTIFVPFCGKSIDMLWLQQQGYHVIGSDLSDEATDDFFKENKLDFDKIKQGDFIVKTMKTSTGSLTLLCGDIFKLQSEHLKQVDLVYDRAGYNSIPSELRDRYAKLITTLLRKGAKMLLGVLDFEGQISKSGPPYYISEEELTTNLRHTLDVTVHAEKRQEYFESNLATKRQQALIQIQSLIRKFLVCRQGGIYETELVKQRTTITQTINNLKETGDHAKITTAQLLEDTLNKNQLHKAMQIIRNIPQKEMQAKEGLKVTY